MTNAASFRAAAASLRVLAETSPYASAHLLSADSLDSQAAVLDEEQAESDRQIAYLDQRTQDHHEWSNRD